MFSNDGIIELGPVDDSIAFISDYYFKDMQVEVRGNRLLYELPEPLKYELVDVGEAYISLLYQTLSDETHQSPLSIEEIESELDKCISVIQGEDSTAKYDRINKCFILQKLCDRFGLDGYGKIAIAL